MKSIEVIVPRSLIKKFYLHPEPYGDGAYVVDLVNGMFTDVFYREMCEAGRRGQCQSQRPREVREYQV